MAAAALHHVHGLVTGSYRKTVAAFALVTDDEDRVLMVRNAIGPRVWNLPGGRIERNERPHEGVVREVLEETGLEVTVDRLAVVDAARTESVVLTFRCSVVGGAARPGPGEIVLLRWTTDEELEREPERRRTTIRLARTAGPAQVHYLG